MHRPRSQLRSISTLSSSFFSSPLPLVSDPSPRSYTHRLLSLSLSLSSPSFAVSFRSSFLKLSSFGRFLTSLRLASPGCETVRSVSYLRRIGRHVSKYRTRATYRVYLFRYLFPLLSLPSPLSCFCTCNTRYRGIARILADLERAARNRCLQLPPRNILLKDWPLRTRTIRRCFHVRPRDHAPLPRVNSSFPPRSISDFARFTFPTDRTGVFGSASIFFLSFLFSIFKLPFEGRKV